MGGNDTLWAFSGDDVIDGGDGTDALRYITARGVRVDLSETGPQNTGGSGIDRIVGVETLVGSDFRDRLTGSRIGNTIDGGGGDDTVIGGAGGDTLVGNGGNDVFHYTHAAHADGDVVIEFNLAGDDVFDLDAIDAHPGGSDDAFTFVASFSGAGGEILATKPSPAGQPGPSFVQADLDGDRVADFTIVIATSFAAPTAVDFIL